MRGCLLNCAGQRDNVGLVEAKRQRQRISLGSWADYCPKELRALTRLDDGIVRKPFHSRIQFEDIDAGATLNVPKLGHRHGLKTSVFLEVEGAAHYLPAYAGNLDIMTSAALACADRIARRRLTNSQPTAPYTS